MQTKTSDSASQINDHQVYLGQLQQTVLTVCLSGSSECERPVLKQLSLKYLVNTSQTHSKLPLNVDNLTAEFLLHRNAMQLGEIPTVRSNI
jgi:hypothetical protein